MEKIYGIDDGVICIILKYLNREIIEKLKEISPYIRRLCLKEEVWNLYVKKDYPKYYYECYGKNEDESWQDYYFILKEVVKKETGRLRKKQLILLKRYKFLSLFHHQLTSLEADIAVRNNQLDILKFLKQYEVFPSRHGEEYALINNQLEIVEFLLKHNYHVHEYKINHIAKNNQKEMLKLLAKYKNFPNLQTIDALSEDGNIEMIDFIINEFNIKILNNCYIQGSANNAAKNGHIKLIKWFEKNYKILPNTKGANSAVENRYYEVVQFLAERGIYPNTEGANAAAKNGDLIMINYLIYSLKVIPDNTGADKAAENGHLDMLKLLKKYNKYLIPSLEGANRAAKNGHVHILNWIEKQSKKQHYTLLPDQKGASMAAEYGHLNVIQWLEKRKVFPDAYGAFRAVKNGYKNILDYLEKLNILPYDYAANLACKHNKLDILDWLEKRGILPNKNEGLSLAAESGHLDAIQWLEEHNIFPDVCIANKAAEKGHIHILEYLEKKYEILPNGLYYAMTSERLNVIKWLASRGIFPNESEIFYAVSIPENIKMIKWIIKHKKLIEEKHQFKFKKTKLCRTAFFNYCIETHHYLKKNL